MTHTYSIAEARARLRTIVDQAEAGLEVELTRRGKPVAVVLSCRELERLRGKRTRFRDAYSSFLDKYSLDEVDLEQEVSSVRDATAGRTVSLCRCVTCWIRALCQTQCLEPPIRNCWNDSTSMGRNARSPPRSGTN